MTYRRLLIDKDAQPIQAKQFKHYAPVRAYADFSSPVSLALSATTVSELEYLTRGVWKRAKLAEAENLEARAVVVDLEEDEIRAEEDDEEVISAVIKINRLTILPGGEIRKGKKRKHDEMRKDSDEEEESEEVEIETGEVPDTNFPFDVPSDDEEEEGQVAGYLSDDQVEIQVDGNPVDTSQNDELEMRGLSMNCPDLTTWEKRHFLFSKFDEGCLLDKSAWYEMSPEVYALAIAERIAKAVKLQEAQDQLPKETESAPSKADADDGYNEAEAVLVDLGYELPDCHSENEADDAVIEIEEGAIDEVKRRPILAACCGVGGDAIALARRCDCRVVALDIDRDKVERCCKQNARVYKVYDAMDFVVSDLNAYADSIATKVTRLSWTETVSLPVIVNGQSTQELIEHKQRHRLRRPFAWCLLSPPWGGPAYRSIPVYSLGPQTFADLIKLIQSASRIADNLCLILPRNQDVDEIIQIASKGTPDFEPFPYVEFDKMTQRSDGYAFFVVVYLCRDASLFLSEKIPKSSRASPAAALKVIKMAKAISVESPREGLPALEVSRKMLLKKRGSDAHLSVAGLHNVIFCRFLLGYLEEPVWQIKTTELVLQLLGLESFLEVVAESLRLHRKGGIEKKDQSAGQRTKGGVFFEVLRRKFRDTANVLRKWRKKTTNAQLLARAKNQTEKTKPHTNNPTDNDQHVKETSAEDQSAHTHQAIEHSLEDANTGGETQMTSNKAKNKKRKRRKVAKNNGAQKTAPSHT